MRVPADCPLWVESLLKTLEGNVESLLIGTKSSDDALKASGAYGLWKVVKEEVELEVLRQTEETRKRNAALNARNAN
jgi:hypothetical protein